MHSGRIYGHMEARDSVTDITRAWHYAGGALAYGPNGARGAESLEPTSRHSTVDRQGAGRGGNWGSTHVQRAADQWPITPVLRIAQRETLRVTVPR